MRVVLLVWTSQPPSLWQYAADQGNRFRFHDTFAADWNDVTARSSAAAIGEDDSSPLVPWNSFVEPEWLRVRSGPNHCASIARLDRPDEPTRYRDHPDATWAFPVSTEEHRAFPAQLWPALAKTGFLGLAIPEEHGASDADALAVAILAEELSRASAGIAITPLVSSHTAAPHLARHGSARQQAEWLPRLAAGEAVAAFAVTEPDVGSDVAGLTTRARRTDEGWVIDGRKMLIANAGLADGFGGTEVMITRRCFPDDRFETGRWVRRSRVAGESQLHARCTVTGGPVRPAAS